MKNSGKYIAHFIKQTAFAGPLVLLVACFITSFLEYGERGYILICNTLGTSIFVDYVLISIFTLNKRYCSITRLAPIGLLIINITDLVGFYLDKNFYNFWYTVTTCALVVGLVIIFYINKKI